jgi:hypothetical protein
MAIAGVAVAHRNSGQLRRAQRTLESVHRAPQKVRMEAVVAVSRSRLTWCVKFSRELQSRVFSRSAGDAGDRRKIRRENPCKTETKNLKNRD